MKKSTIYVLVGVVFVCGLVLGLFLPQMIKNNPPVIIYEKGNYLADSTGFCLEGAVLKMIENGQAACFSDSAVTRIYYLQISHGIKEIHAIAQAWNDTLDLMIMDPIRYHQRERYTFSNLSYRHWSEKPGGKKRIRKALNLLRSQDITISENISCEWIMENVDQAVALHEEGVLSSDKICLTAIEAYYTSPISSRDEKHVWHNYENKYVKLLPAAIKQFHELRKLDKEKVTIAGKTFDKEEFEFLRVNVTYAMEWRVRWTIHTNPYLINKTTELLIEYTNNHSHEMDKIFVYELLNDLIWAAKGGFYWGYKRDDVDDIKDKIYCRETLKVIDKFFSEFPFQKLADCPDAYKLAKKYFFNNKEWDPETNDWQVFGRTTLKRARELLKQN